MDKLDKVMAELKTAYADCLLPWEESQDIRNLSWKASESLTPAEATFLMAQVVEGYNRFTAELLCRFPPDCKIFLAREGSVCIYVVKGESPLPPQRHLLADEYDEVENGLFRIWWD